MRNSAINSIDKLALIHEHWSLRVVAEMNDIQFKLVKTIRRGEIFVVPKSVEHITRAAKECHALIIEPRGVINTGGADGEMTAHNDVRI